MSDKKATNGALDEAAHILIADDQLDNVLILEDVLADKYSVHVVSDGEKVLHYIESGAPVDLILLDVVMPGLDGFEVCRLLKARPEVRDVPILFLSSLDRDTDEAYGLSLGAEDFIHKPISPAVILARVGNHLKLARATRLIRERSEDMERLATRAAGLGIWDYDVAGNRMDWNDEMFGLYGLSRHDFGGSFLDLFSLIHPEDVERMKRDYGAGLEGERDIASEFRIVRPDGDIRVIKSNATIRRDGFGAPIRLLGTNWDVTDYRRAVEEMTRAKTRAEAASVAKSNFLATMSHELRTPLNAIIGFGQLLRVGETRPDCVEQLDIICQSAANLLRMIQDILDLSKIESGRLALDCHRFDLAEEISLVIKYFHAEMRSKGLQLKVGIAKDLPPCLFGDAGLLRQILVNLVGNAVKFTAHGRIEVTVERLEPLRADGKVVLGAHVTDTGTGIRPENQARIFDMFEQEDNSSTRRFGGVGLGLAISKRLVSLLGGRIWLSSALGIGSRFSFTAVMERADRDEPAADAQPRVPAVVSGKSILVVEDDAANRMLMIDILTRSHFHVVVAEDGEAAASLLRQRPFDLVLMDIQLPEVSGIEVTRRIRAGHIEGCDPAVPIIAVTAYAGHDDRARFLDHGVTAYLSKPINVDEFIGMVRTVLSEDAQVRR